VAKDGSPMIAMLPRTMLEARESGDVIAFVSVLRVQLTASGSRSEKEVFTLQVNQCLAGACPDLVKASRYVTDKDPTLQRGNQYIVALQATHVEHAPYILRAFVSTAESQEREAIEAHLAILLG
jgi:hypothetical protein